MRTPWPKQPLMLSEEETRLKERIISEHLQWGYRGLLGWIQASGHVHVERLSHKTSVTARVLEVGCGRLWHLNVGTHGRYYGLDYSLAHLRQGREKFPGVSVIQGDAYLLPFCDAAFHRVISVYTMEHLHRLPDALFEIRRVLRPGGEFVGAIPTEGGLATSFGRWLTSKRYFERKYNVDYLKIVRSEHCNTYKEVIVELRRVFRSVTLRYLPFYVLTGHLNPIVVYRAVDPACVPEMTLECAGESDP